MIAGIDPGLSGGIAIIDDTGKPIFVSPLQLIAGKEVDTRALGDTLDHFSVSCTYLERAQAFPKQGVSSAFNYGVTFGVIYGVARSVGAVVLVSPAKWHRVMCAGTPTDISTKQRAQIAAERLFPDVDLRATTKARKAHDGMVDALLIAAFGRRGCA